MTRSSGCSRASSSAIAPLRSGEPSSTITISNGPPSEASRCRALCTMTATVFSSLKTGKKRLTEAGVSDIGSEPEPPVHEPGQQGHSRAQKAPHARMVHDALAAELANHAVGHGGGVGPPQQRPASEGEVRVEVAEDVEADAHGAAGAGMAQALEVGAQRALCGSVDKVRAAA